MPWNLKGFLRREGPEVPNLLTGQPFWRQRDGIEFNYVEVIGDLDESSFSEVVKLKGS